MATVTVTSFGYLHGSPPVAHLVLDLRHHFRDPHVRPELRHLTARDREVRAAVLGTPGIRELIDATATTAGAFLAGPSKGPLTIAVGCAGGRHRAPTVGAELADRIAKYRRARVQLVHRDLTKPVVNR